MRETAATAEQTTAAARSAASAAVDEARRTGDEKALTEATRALAEAQKRHDTAARGLREAIAALLAARGGLLGHLQPTDELTALTGLEPIALLPVRVETRFTDTPELWVRVFPDDIHVNTHDAGLTADEIEWGEHFWAQTWVAANDDDRGAAWQQLTTRVPPRRAAWIARELRPTNLAQQGTAGATPAFPSPATRPAPWSRAATATTLPDRWIVLGYSGGHRTLLATGTTIPDPLPVGPDPMVAAAAADPEHPAVDDGVRWRVDFDAAVAIGMGLKIPLSAQQASDGFDRLLVIGVKPTLTTKSAGLRLGKLFDAHHFTDGLTLPAPGTPTNATQDARPPTTQATTDATDGGFEIERGASLATVTAGSDGYRLAHALGIPPTTFAHVDGAAGTTFDDARHMDTVLWPGGLGYYLDQLFAPLMGAGTLADVRRHALDRVRARGPLALLRTGRQPYGVLPVTSLHGWQNMGEAAVLTPIVTLLQALADEWVDLAQTVPRVGLGNPDATLIGLLELNEHARTIRARPATSRDFERNVALLLLEDVVAIDQQWAALALQTSKLLGRIGIGGTPRITELGVQGAAAVLDAPLIDGSFDPNVGPAHHYLAQIAGGNPQQLWHATNDAKLLPLLYMLARHSVLRAWTDAGDALIGASAATHAEPVLSGWPGAAPTAWERMTSGSPTLFVQVDNAAAGANPTPTLTALNETRAAADALAQLNDAQLELLLRESLGLASHRLDAWITSIATARLDVLRNGHVGSGVHLGAWGWLENVRPGPALQPTTVPDGVTGPVWHDPGNGGYVHAPSLTHAATAAVLRSGYLTHKATSAGTLGVDLSSDRTRRALELIDGVREGQSPGALLGYRFERDLHERRTGLELDAYIAPLRAAFPLVAGKRVEETEPVEAIAAANVVDGLALLRGRAQIAWGDDLPANGSTEQEAIDAALDDLADVADAVDDLLLAESVHQAVAGNPARAAATMDALSRGENPPPQFDVVRTPRSGVGLTHRLAVLFSGAAGSGWTAPRPVGPDTLSGPRAALDPQLEAWAAALLPDPAHVFFNATITHDVRGHPFATRVKIAVTDVGLGALDVVAAAVPGETPEQSTLERLLGYHAARAAPAHLMRPGGPDSVTVDYERTWGNDGWTIPELLTAASIVRPLFDNARPALAGDVGLPGQAGGSSDLSDLHARVDAVAAALADADRRLAIAANIRRPVVPPIGPPVVQPPIPIRPPLRPTPVASAEDQRAALLAAAALGVQGACPQEPVGDTFEIQSALAAQAISVRKEVTRRLAAAAELPAANPLASETAQVRAARERLRVLFGAAPPFTVGCQAADPTELAAALADGPTSLGDDPLAADALLLDAAAVRRGPARLADALLARAAADPDAAASADLIVAQLPHDQGAHWIGLPLNGAAPKANRLSLLIHAPEALDANSTLRGLVVDEWTETIPNPQETTGLTFHYDAPAAEAPQAILLAVPQAPQTTWSLGALETILLETTVLTRMRGVDAAALGDLGQLLPAWWPAQDTAGLTVSSDPRHAVTALWPAPPGP